MQRFAIKPEQLDGQVAVVPQLHQSLRDLIVSGELSPGMRLSETEIAAAYAVSRQPVREAFIKLAEEGLLEVRPQRGSYVKKISIGAVMDARFVREAIEADIVRLAARSADQALVRALRDLIRGQKAVADEAGRAFVALDDRFHQTIAEAADKRHVWEVLSGLKVQMDRVRQIATKAFPIRRLISQHEAVVNAIERGDSDVAEAAMRLHLQEILNDLPSIAAAHAAFFDETERDKKGRTP